VVLKQVEMGMPVSNVMRQQDVAERTFSRRNELYTELQPDQARAPKPPQEGRSTSRCASTSAKPRSNEVQFIWFMTSQPSWTRAVLQRKPCTFPVRGGSFPGQAP